MTNVMLEDLLKLGLNKNEAKAYLAAVELQVFSGGELSKRAAIKRPTAYLALDRLKDLGLISVIASTGTKRYKVEKPSALKKLTQRMRRKTVEAELLLDTLVPQLTNLRRVTIEEPVVTLYEGINNFKNILLEISASKDSWFVFGSSAQLFKQIAKKDVKEILEEGDKLRYEANLPKIYLITDESIGSTSQFKGELSSRELRMLPEVTDLGSALILTKDKLVLLNYSAPFVVVLKSKEVVDMVKLMYKLIWKQL